MKTIFSFIRSLKFSDKKHGFAKANNLKYSNRSRLVLAIAVSISFFLRLRLRGITPIQRFIVLFFLINYQIQLNVGK